MVYSTVVPGPGLRSTLTEMVPTLSAENSEDLHLYLCRQGCSLSTDPKVMQEARRAPSSKLPVLGLEDGTSAEIFPASLQSHSDIELARSFSLSPDRRHKPLQTNTQNGVGHLGPNAGKGHHSSLEGVGKDSKKRRKSVKFKPGVPQGNSGFETAHFLEKSCPIWLSDEMKDSDTKSRDYRDQEQFPRLPNRRSAPSGTRNTLLSTTRSARSCFVPVVEVRPPKLRNMKGNPSTDDSMDTLSDLSYTGDHEDCVSSPESSGSGLGHVGPNSRRANPAPIASMYQYSDRAESDPEFVVVAL